MAFKDIVNAVMATAASHIKSRKFVLAFFGIFVSFGMYVGLIAAYKHPVFETSQCVILILGIYAFYNAANTVTKHDSFNNPDTSKDINKDEKTE